MNQESLVSALSRRDFLPLVNDAYQSSSSSSSSTVDDWHRRALGNVPSNQSIPKRFARDSSGKLSIVHPYARLFAKEDDTKRRRIWNHALEKNIFTPYELCVDRFLSHNFEYDIGPFIVSAQRLQHHIDVKYIWQV
jgi:hypothetical protein